MRYFTRDDEQKAAVALALLRCIQAGTEQVTTSPLVLFEVVFLLERTYQLPKDRVADAVLSVPLTFVNWQVIPYTARVKTGRSQPGRSRCLRPAHRSVDLCGSIDLRRLATE